MPLVQRAPFFSSYLVYDAPLDEKTKEIRKNFDVDEETGYPKHYEWRNLARLGPSYSPADPYLKFDPYDPKTSISTHVTAALIALGSTASAMIFINLKNRRPWWAQSWVPLLGSAVFVALELWIHQKNLGRQSLKNAIIIDYVRQHPERFPPIKRPKMRETLSTYIPIR